MQDGRFSRSKQRPLVDRRQEARPPARRTTSLLNGGVTLYLLLTQSITNFVIIKAFLGPTTTTMTIVIGLWWFRRTMNRAGIEVILARRVGATAPVHTMASPMAISPAGT